MKHFFFLLLFMPVLVFAQVDTKYSVGKVPTVDGKIIFSKQISIPNMSRDQIFDVVLAWAETRFVPEKNMQSRILYINKDKGQIACAGEEYIVFAERALSLDRSEIGYRMTIFCSPEKCDIEISNITYQYNPDKPNERFDAEDWITDEMAFNKSKTKFYRNYGKFRMKTIDLVENLFAEVKSAINKAVVSNDSLISESSTDAMTSSVMIQEGNQGSLNKDVMLGYKNISPEKIPGNIIKLLSEAWMLITAGNETEFNMMTASWGGLGYLYDKPVAFCFISPLRYTYQLMEKNDTYTISFYTEAYRDILKYCGTHTGGEIDKVKETGLTPITTPNGSKTFSEAWMIIECKKMIAQSITPESISDKDIEKEWSGKRLHKMYIGEILNVWIK